MKSPPQSSNAASHTGPRAWLPLAFVVGSLVLLLVTPFITGRRVANIRVNVVDLTNEARILVSEFEGAFAEELVIASAGPDGSIADDPGRTRAISSAFHAVVAAIGSVAAASSLKCAGVGTMPVSGSTTFSASDPGSEMPRMMSLVRASIAPAVQ